MQRLNLWRLAAASDLIVRHERADYPAHGAEDKAKHWYVEA